MKFFVNFLPLREINEKVISGFFVKWMLQMIHNRGKIGIRSQSS